MKHYHITFIDMIDYDGEEYILRIRKSNSNFLFLKTFVKFVYCIFFSGHREFSFVYLKLNYGMNYFDKTNKTKKKS